MALEAAHKGTGSASRAGSSNLWIRWVVAAIVIGFGVALRIAYYDNGRGQSDESITVEVIRHMRQSGDWDVNWAKAALSDDLRYDQYNFSTHLYATYFFYRVVKLVPGTAEWRSRQGGFLVYRMFVALLAAASVVLTFAVARRLFGFRVAIGAALLTSISPILVQDAHYVRPEALTTTLTLAAVWLCIPQSRFSEWRVHAACLCVGLLIACKVSMVLLAWLPLVPVLHCAAQSRTSIRRVVTAALSIVSGFFIGAPGALLHPTQFIHGIIVLSRQYAGVHPPHGHINGDAVADMMLSYFSATWGVTVLALLAIGLAAIVFRRNWVSLLLVGGPLAAFAVFFATRSVFFERNISHVVPGALIIAAFGTMEVANVLSRAIRFADVPLAAALFVLGSLTSARVTSRLVTREYTGQASAAHDQYDAEIAARHPGAMRWNELLLTSEPLDRLARHFTAGGQPVLFRVTDYRDEWTREHLAELKRGFAITPVGDFPGTFPDLPTCTLLTYYTARDVYFLVEERRK